MRVYKVECKVKLSFSAPSGLEWEEFENQVIANLPYSELVSIEDYDSDTWFEEDE